MLSQDTLASFLYCGTILSAGPGQLRIGWGPRTPYASPPSTDEPSFYFPDFFLSSTTPWFMHAQTQNISHENLLQHLSAPAEPQSIAWQNTQKDFFLATVRQLKSRIQAQELTKAVPFIFSTSPQTLSPSQLHSSLVHALRYIQHHPGHLYGSWTAHEGILGVTPETLFTLNKASEEWMLKSEALAGTVPSGQSCANPKLIHEHQVVIDGINEALMRFGKPHTGPLKTLDLPHLRHLMTPIEMSLMHPPAFEEIVQALHPTPALGAHPREVGRYWLLDYQRHFDRLRFGAPVGYTDPSTQISRCFVAIRNVQWQPNRMLIGAGCGIVADSDPETEWNEILLKLKAVKALLNL